MLRSVGQSGADDPYDLLAFCEANEQEAILAGVTGEDLPELLGGVLLVIKDRSQGIVKNCQGLVKTNSVLCQVRGSLGFVPFELHMPLL